jgi:hypothetical protein
VKLFKHLLAVTPLTIVRYFPVGLEQLLQLYTPFKNSYLLQSLIICVLFKQFLIILPVLIDTFTAEYGEVQV